MHKCTQLRLGRKTILSWARLACRHAVTFPGTWVAVAQTEAVLAVPHVSVKLPRWRRLGFESFLVQIRLAALMVHAGDVTLQDAAYTIVQWPDVGWLEQGACAGQANHRGRQY